MLRIYYNMLTEFLQYIFQKGRWERNLQNKSKRSSALTLAGVSLLVLSAAFIALYVFTTDPEIQRWYAKYEEVLYKFDMAVVSIGYNQIIALVIFALYVVKCFAPIISIPAVCVLTGMVFPTVTALMINFTGCFIMMTVKYKFGEAKGGGRAKSVLDRNEISRTLIEHNGTGNPWLLFAFRLIPSFPINPVSQMYGSLKFDYPKYIGISMLGFAPKLLSYTFIGLSVFDPLSFKFFLPIIVLLGISGISVLIVNAALNHYKK